MPHAWRNCFIFGVFCFGRALSVSKLLTSNSRWQDDCAVLGHLADRAPNPCRTKPHRLGNARSQQVSVYLAKKTPSHVSGERSLPLLKQTIPALFSDTVSKYGTLDAAIFVGQDKRFTWSELSDTVDALAAGFLALGLEKGDRVGIWSPNRWEWLVTQFATARIGLILVNINPAYRLTELEYALNKVGCRALISAVRFKTSDYLGMAK